MMTVDYNSIDYNNAKVVIEGLILAFTILKWVSPLLVGCLGFYGYKKFIEHIDKRADKKKELEEKSKKSKQSNNKETVTQKQLNSIQNNSIDFDNYNSLMHRLDNCEEPIDKSKYRSLNLEFGKDGKIKT